MNANEIADLLADSNDPDIRRAVAMLRQQQAKLTKYELRHAEQRKRIEELEKEVKHWQDAFHKGVRL